MIPEKKGETQLTSTLSGQKIKFELDPDGTQHLMGILSEMYADPLMALIREYSTNARDSHIEAGNRKPIEVTLPSALQPNLIIQDYGVGLDVNDIHEIYTKYGASTKRNSNDAVGMFGIGSKAALASVDQFSIVAIKNGVKIQCSVAKNEEGVPELTVVSSNETTDSNGVKIIIPVSKASEVESKAKEFFQYWPEGSVLVNGEKPKQLDSILELTHKDGTKILVRDASSDPYSYDRSKSRHIAVMGGVPYPMALTKNDLHYSKKLLVFADIGDFHFTPSREAILDTPKSQEYIKNFEQKFVEAYEEHIQNLTSKAKTKPEFVKLYNDSVNIVNTGSIGVSDINNLKFNGMSVPSKYAMPVDKNGHTTGTFITTNNHSWAKNSHSTVTSIYITRFPNCVFVANFAPSKFISTHANKLSDWVNEIDNDDLTKLTSARDSSFVLFSGEVPKMIKEWTHDYQITDWQEVLAASRHVNKKSGNTSSAGGPNDHYDCVTETGYLEKDKVHIDEVKNAKHCFWFARPRVNDDRYSGEIRKIRSAQNVLSGIYPDAIFVTVPLNRVSKLEKASNKIKKGEIALSEEYAKWRDSLSNEQRQALFGRYNDGYEKRYIELLCNANDKAHLTDPALKEIVKKFQKVRTVKADAKLVKEQEMWYKMGYSEQEGPLVEIPSDVKAKYPLIFTGNVYSPTEDYLVDISLYANAKHKTKDKV